MKNKTISPKQVITSNFGALSIFPGKKYAYKLDKTDKNRILVEVMSGVSIAVDKGLVNFN